MDRQWWETYIKEVNAEFTGAKYTCNPLPGKFGVTKLPRDKFKTYGNSGASCISLAAYFGAKRIIMLGFDAQKTNGEAHWHGNHPRNLGNAGQIGKWPEKFKELKADLGAIEIINASRQTALMMFKRESLEDALKESD